MITRIIASLLFLVVATTTHAETALGADTVGKQSKNETAGSTARPVTVLAPFKLAAGKSEVDLIAASNQFQNQFVDHRPGIIRRELVRTGDGKYLDIVQFRSAEDAEAIMKEEMESDVCHVYFSVMNMEGADASGKVDFYPSLATYSRATK